MSIIEPRREKSSQFCPACSVCGDSGFQPVQGGVISCSSCRRQHPRPPDAAPAPAPVSFGPPSGSGNHRTKILEMLRAAGPTGVLNVLFYEKVCKRPPSRIFELRKQGYTIRTIREGESVFRFVLIAEPAVVKGLPSYEPKKPAGVTANLFAEAGR